MIKPQRRRLRKVEPQRRRFCKIHLQRQRLCNVSSFGADHGTR
jgi:hypothetical protein